jgi:tetratricopeptide (TPR) repeat protein
MTAPSIFISYSHKDEEWKDRLVTHLGVLVNEGILDVWEDRQIEAGDDWKPEIENALNKAAVAILMISANFLSSKFILGEEVPKLLKRRSEEGIRIIPVIVKPCAWNQVRWLSPIQSRPKDGRPLSSGSENQIDADLAALVNEIATTIKHLPNHLRVIGIVNVASSLPPFLQTLPPEKISLAKLPSTSPDLFGREDRLKQLDEAWNNQDINVLSLVAWGGVGKTALVNKWISNIAKDNYRGAERVYGWSFYSQGAAEGRQVSADQFIAAALTWFGDPDPTAGNPWDKGERLAEYIKKQRILLILDGLEPLQSPPPVETGKIKDPGLTSLLRELARQNPGLVVISTRLPVDDLKDFIGSTAKEIDLEALSDEAGAEYLKHLGVDGIEEERKQASHDFGGHALALTLLGRYLKVVYSGDVRKRGEIPRVMDEQKQGKHARRVMESYEAFLKGKPELDILRLMGLFDRPAPKSALDALRKEPAIDGLTNELQKLNDVNWKFAVSNLRDMHLLAEQDPYELDTIDCHPLLREHFGEKLKADNPNAWHEAHGRLYEYYKSSVEELPDTIEEMTPLYAAVMHGCQAKQYKNALEDVYDRRILRNDATVFSWRNLGTFSADLATLSNFFADNWNNLAIGDLTQQNKASLMYWTGFCLRALGRLNESVQVFQHGLQIAELIGDWRNATYIARYLGEAYLTIGDIATAIDYGKRCVFLADKDISKDNFLLRLASKATLADAQHQIGNFIESEDTFREAEEIQKVWDPYHPFLYAFQGLRYCELLLTQDKYKQVEDLAIKNIKIGEEKGWLNAKAYGYLSLSKSQLLLMSSEQIQDSTLIEDHFERAVSGLRQAGSLDQVPRGLLARAEYYRIVGDFSKAQKDLDEAFTIAMRGGMALHLADYHLGYARLYLAKGERAKAREHWQIAKDSIEKMGYHRRDKEVQKLEEQLK